MFRETVPRSSLELLTKGCPPRPVPPLDHANVSWDGTANKLVARCDDFRADHRHGPLASVATPTLLRDFRKRPRTGSPPGRCRPRWCRRGEFHPPPQPQTGRASFPASGFPDCLDRGTLSTRSHAGAIHCGCLCFRCCWDGFHNLLWTTSTFIENPPD